MERHAHIGNILVSVFPPTPYTSKTLSTTTKPLETPYKTMVTPYHQCFRSLHSQVWMVWSQLINEMKLAHDKDPTVYSAALRPKSSSCQRGISMLPR